MLPNYTLSVCQPASKFAETFCHCSAMPRDPQRFAQRVIDAFVEAGRRTEAQIAKADGPSTSTMTKLRKVAAGEATMSEPREPTWTKIENAAGWAPGSARKVWDGGEPVAGQEPTEAEALAELRAELQQLRSEVETLKRGQTG